MFLADELFQICRAHSFGERLRGRLLLFRWGRSEKIHGDMLTYLDAAETGRIHAAFVSAASMVSYGGL